ncbi:MAG: secretin and TonB N-terminal domain-containing protein [Planctomycetota bacterium]
MPSHPSRNRLLAAAVALVALGTADTAVAQSPIAPPAPAAQQSDDPFAENAPDAVVPAEEAEQNAAVSYDAAADTLDIRVSNADLVDVLRMLAEQSERNLIASKNVAGVVSANLYDVTLAEALDAMLKTNGLAAREEGNFVYVYTQEELAELEEANRRVETKAFRLFHTPPGMAARMVAPALSDVAVISVSDEAESGVASNASDAGGYNYSAGDVLVISDFQENLAEVERLLDEVDKRPQQVLVEATILSATLTEDNQLGVDFNLVGGVDFNAVNFLPGGQIFSGATDAIADLGSDAVVAGGTGNNFSGPTNGGLKVGFVSGDVSLFLSALEGVTDSTVLANPKVLAVNKQKGEVLVGRQDGYLTTTLTETSATQDVQFLETGTKLVFRPYISRDGYVRLEIAPEDSSGGVDERGLPSKVTTQVTSNVMVKDGKTIVIGGLFRESSIVAKAHVPVLGNIPIVGRFFGRQSDATVREEIIILLTPHVIKDDDKYAELGEAEKLRAERLRVGTRRGMMAWGRERQAQAYYRRAVEALAQDNPNPKSARFHLNAALQLNPSFLEALELREELVGRAFVAADGSSVRSFVERSIRDDAVEAGVDMPEPDAPATQLAPTTQPN